MPSFPLLFLNRSPLLGALQHGARARAVVAGTLLLAGALPAWAAGESTMYSCVDARGRKLTSDRPIKECLDREQRVLNRDGSQRQVLPPSLTSDERAALEEAERRRVVERAAQADAIRRDRNLVNRYPNEGVHNKAREAALVAIRKAITASERRLSDMENDRKPLLDEAEFYKGRALPSKLKTQMEYIDVTVDAQKTIIQNQRAEEERINEFYDLELARLKRLWAGAQPGTLGPLPEPPSARPAAAGR